jgi:hypothetical protein
VTVTTRALAERMPHLLLGMAVFVLASWWMLARGGQEQQHRQPPPAQDSSGAASSCDPCGACDCACEAGDLCSSCDACDVGSCDCVAVPPGAVTHTFEAAGRPAPRPGQPRDRHAGLKSWASLGLLVPLAVMFWWRRRR